MALQEKIISGNPIPNTSTPISNGYSTRVPDNSTLIPNSSNRILDSFTLQQNELEIDLDNLERNLRERIPMKDYLPNIRDEIRRTCILMSLLDLKIMIFPFTLHWLEYNISKYATFCFYCYIFKIKILNNQVVMSLLRKALKIGSTQEHVLKKC